MLDTIFGNIPSLLLYLAVFAASAALVFYGLSFLKKSKKILGASLLIIGLLIPPVIAGIRSGIGHDYYSYLSMYNNAIVGEKLYFRFIEPASTFLIKGSGAIRSSFLMFFSFSLITNTCLFFACRNIFHKDNKRITLAYLIMLLLHFSTSLNVMRSITAVAIIALAFSIVFKKRNARRAVASMALVLVAALFHLTALLAFAFVPAFWIIFGCKGKKKPLVITITWALYSIAAAILPAIFFAVKSFVPLGDYGRYLGKVGHDFSMPLANILMIIPIVTASIILYYRNGKERPDENMANLFSCASFYVPISIAISWITYAGGLSRISFMFDPIIVFLIVYLITPPKKISIAKTTIVAVIMSMIVGLMFIRNTLWSGILPYKTMFNPSEARIIKLIDDGNKIPLGDSKMTIFILNEEAVYAPED